MVKNKDFFLLVGPALSIVSIISFVSICWLFFISFYNFTFGDHLDSAKFVGFENYINLLFGYDDTFYDSLKITFVYILSSLFAELIIGFSVALLLSKVKKEAIFVTILIIPIILMPSMVGMIGRLYFSYDGLVNYIIELVSGFKFNWYGKDLALFATILVDIWEWTPFFILIIHAGLKSIPVEPIEAAKVEGASSIQIFINVTYPLLKPLIFTALLLRLMDILRIFDVIFSMFSGGPGISTTTLPLFVYRSTLVAEEVGKGSAVSILLIIVIIFLSIILINYRNRALFEY